MHVETQKMALWRSQRTESITTLIFLIALVVITTVVQPFQQLTLANPRGLPGDSLAYVSNVGFLERHLTGVTALAGP